MLSLKMYTLLSGYNHKSLSNDKSHAVLRSRKITKLKLPMKHLIITQIQISKFDK